MCQPDKHVMIEAEGDAAARAIEMALQALAPRGGAVVATLAPAAAPPAAGQIAAPASPARKRIAAPSRRHARSEAAGPPPAVAPHTAAPSRRGPDAADAAERIDVIGITVAGHEIGYGGKTITVTRREAQLAGALAKVSPSLLDPDRIARDVWGRPRADVQALIYQTGSALNAAVQAIGLKVHTQRGIGVALVPA